MHGRVTVWVLLLFGLFLLLKLQVSASEIRGRVVSVAGGEPLARVQAEVLETGARATTASDGTFTINSLAPGSYTLRLNAVGFRLSTILFTLTGDENKDFEITLVPDNFRRTEKVEVKGDIFQGPDSPAVLETNLTSLEIRETSTVLADDPFRSIQTLPGVTAAGGNDFFAQFSVMGAAYDTTSIYVDGILVPSPFHGTNIAEGATLSIFTSETLEDIKLLPAAYPEKYGDAVGAALDIQTRDGSRTTPTFRASAGIADSDFLGEGALDKEKKGAWLVSARKSYLGYLLHGPLHNVTDDISFYDGSLKLTYDLAPNHNVSFYGVGGHTVYDLKNSPKNLEPDTIFRATNDFMMGRIGWRWTVTPHFLLDSRAAYLQSPLSYSNPSGNPLENDHYGELVGGSSLVWSWRKDYILEGGWMTRRVTGSRVSTAYNPDGTVLTSSAVRGLGWKNDGYLQQASSFFGNRLHVVGGLRMDTASEFGIHPVSPQVSASIQASPSTQLQFGIGRYNQFDVPVTGQQFPLPNGICSLSFEQLQTANHYTFGVERRLHDNSRVRMTLFNRQNGVSFAENASAGCAPIFSSHGPIAQERDYSRGAQIVLQGRSASRLSGWIGYTLTYARQSLIGHLAGGGESITAFFPTLQDQRHTINAFASYQIKPTVRLTGKWQYGSGFPIPTGNIFVRPRLGDYQRLDARAEKDLAFTRWKLALYGELLNATNHYNPRYFYSSINPDGTFNVVTGQGLPITPTAGVAFEF